MKRRKTYRRRKTTRQLHGWQAIRRDLCRQTRGLIEHAKMAMVYAAIFLVIYLAVFWHR